MTADQSTTFIMLFMILGSFSIFPAVAIVPPLPMQIISLCSGDRFTCVVFKNNQLKCSGLANAWGAYSFNGGREKLGDSLNELGDNMPVINVGSDLGILKVSCGGNHICIKADTGDIKCLGYNRYGQLGLGISTETVGSASGHIGDDLPFVNVGIKIQVLDVVLGYYHTCVLLTGNKVKCFGMGEDGEHGLGDNKDRGKLSSDMGDNLPFIDFGTGVEVASLHSSTSSLHNCVILSSPSQRVKCWGYNDDSELGYGDRNNRGDNPGEMGDNLPLVDLGVASRVKNIALGGYHSCFLLVNDKLKCVGYGYFGQLGSGSSDDIKSTGSTVPIVPLDPQRSIFTIAGGEEYTCIVYDDQITMKCNGRNDNGQLGAGDATHRGNTPETVFPNITAINLGVTTQIDFISTGGCHVCVAFVDFTIKCFGCNNLGQLAIGSSNNIGDQANEMGENLQYALFLSPTSAPSKTPTKTPTRSPTLPTAYPTLPTKSPIIVPTSPTTLTPTKNPETNQPTKSPLKVPSRNPTRSPKNAPETNAPTKSPKNAPETNAPTKSPKNAPETNAPTSTTARSENSPAVIGLGVGLGVTLASTAAFATFIFRIRNKPLMNREITSTNV